MVDAQISAAIKRLEAESLKLSKTKKNYKSQPLIDAEQYVSSALKVESEGGDLKTFVSKHAVAGLASILAPEMGAARLPDGSAPTAMLHDTQVFAANPIIQDGSGHAILSPTSNHQFFLNTDAHGTQFVPDNRKIEACWAPAASDDATVRIPNVACFYQDGVAKYIESPDIVKIQYSFNGAGEDALEVIPDEAYSGAKLAFLDGDGNAITLTDAAGNTHTHLSLTNPIILFKSSFPETDAVKGYNFYVTSVTEIDGISVLADQAIGVKRNVYGVIKTCNEFGTPNQMYLYAPTDGLSFTGYRYNILEENETVGKMAKRVISADIFAEYTGSALNNSYVSARTFEDTVFIPHGVTEANWLSSGARGYSKPMMSKNNGIRAWYIPQLSPSWKDCIQTFKNNPWTGRYDSENYYMFATRIRIDPTDSSVQTTTYKGSVNIELVGSNRIFNYATAPADPMWPIYHSALVNEYRITPNDSHWDNIKGWFSNTISNVADFGKNLLSNKEVQSVIKAGAEVAIPMFLGALAL